MSQVFVEAEPGPLAIDVDRTALVIIDMQRDFLEPGGFGETLGNNVSLLDAAVKPCAAVLDAARRRKMLVVHTREGHRPDLSDAPKAKVERGEPQLRIGAKGPMGRILIRGEPGHDIVAKLYPKEGEAVVDKPGKGAFYATDLHAILQNRGIESLIVCGVTTEVCVHTTVREANDRGFKLPRPRRLLRLVLSRISRGRVEDDQGSGRNLRVGFRFEPCAQGAGVRRLED